MLEENEFTICMNQLKEQINKFSSLRSSRESFTAVQENTSTLRISNRDVKYQLLHGAAFR